MRKRRKGKKHQDEEMHDRLIRRGDTAMLASGILVFALSVLKLLRFLGWV